ncbi:MAG: class I SAM-dependent methyltransferase [Janthinobacterium lividum]
MSGADEYLLGHSDHELERLQVQASILRPTTRRLIEEAGVRPGMRVLDVGSGAGDVALLAAEMVGSDGSVVGLDESAQAVRFATRRAAGASVTNLRFHCAKAEAYDDAKPFDVVVGRYVLLFQVDPVAFLRSLKAKMASGGIIALHEINDASDFTAVPHVRLLDEVNSRAFRRFRSALPHHDVASRLYSVFQEAGLPGPHLTCERLAAGGGVPNPMVQWLVLTYVTIFGDRAGEQPSIDAVQLTREIEREVDELGSQVASPEQWYAWAKLP